MPSPQKKVDLHTFTEGINTVVAKELMPANQAKYILNCNILSTANGDVGIVTNIKGNKQISFTLPDGDNECIGSAVDEESNNFYFAIRNSNNYHTWYRYNSVDRSVIVVLQSLTDSNDEPLWYWTDGELILHADIVGNNLLYWTIRYDTPRKFNIGKALDKSTNGYGVTVLQDYTRAYKRTANLAPKSEYFSDTTKSFNRLYGFQFKFATRFIYDDNEKSNWSDYSNVPYPNKEPITGINSVPTDNNGIKITVETGSDIVNMIEIGMLQTNPEGGTYQWVSIALLDKKKLLISSNSNYIYNFYNDGSYAVTDPEKIVRPYSYLPVDALCQSFVKNALVYANFSEGFENVTIDITKSVGYSPLFIASGTNNELNNAQILFVQNNAYYEGGGFLSGGGWRHTVYTVTIGSDVKKGNLFQIFGRNGASDNYTYSYTATLLDNATTVANQLRSQIKANSRYSSVTNPTADGGGNVSFSFDYLGQWNEGYTEFTGYVNKVPLNSLKDTGQSVPNIKMGSSFKVGIMYEDYDGRKSLTYTVDALVVNVNTINQYGQADPTNPYQTTTVTLTINHKPPIWARYYQIVRSRDLTYGNYIQLLIQKAVDVQATNNDEYIDLVIGSLFTYQAIHKNTTLKYNFTKGDRIRFIKKINTSDPQPANDVYYDFYETEIISYINPVIQQKDENITLNGTDTVTVAVSSADNIGSILRVDGIEREIIAAPTGSTYQLNNTLAGGGDNGLTSIVKPYYEIENRNGVLRIKKPSTPTIIDFSVVEVYTPSISGDLLGAKQFFEFGYKFPIIDFGTDNRIHAGNSQNQTDVLPAIVKIANGTAYVRNREMPTNNAVDNVQVVISTIEDPSFSDFYISNLNDNGRENAEDTGTGVVHFGSRFRYSNNFIEDTRINGLNDFDNSDREDYNDKYGDVKRTVFDENRIYTYKELKTAWIPVLQNIITQANGETILGLSSKLLNNMQYFAWDGGVGSNPEAFTENGTSKYHGSPNSGVIIRLGGNGEIPISEVYQVDNAIRGLLRQSSNNKGKIYFGYDRLNGNLIVSFAPHPNYSYDNNFNTSDWVLYDNPLPIDATYEIVGSPVHGTLDTTDPYFPIFTPDTDYVGEGDDEGSFQYRSLVDGIYVTRKVCIPIKDVPNRQTGWEAQESSAYCVTESGDNTGYKAWTTLEEIYLDDSSLTGNTKPNVDTDADYVEPVYDDISCPVNIVLPDFDFLKITYAWETSAGNDLDTFTGLIDTGTAYDGIYVGYGQPDPKVPAGSSTPYVWWAGDNTSGGKETVLVDFKQFLTDNPSVPNPVKIRLNAVWYSGKLTGDVSVGITTYKGGTMSLDAPTHDFINSGGVVVTDTAYPTNIALSSSSGNIINSQDVAIVAYNQTDNSATIIPV